MKYILKIESQNPDNNMMVHCDDAVEMARLTSRAILQGYVRVIAEQLEEDKCE